MRGRSIGEDSLAVFDRVAVMFGAHSNEHVLDVFDLVRERGRPTRDISMSSVCHVSTIRF